MSVSAAPFQASAGNTPGSLMLSGVLDFATAPAVFAQSGEWFKPDICEIDLAGISKADSAALAMLVVWAAQVQWRGNTLSYRHVPEGLRALAKSCAVDAVLNIRAD
ncbi:STAS domain-containing protein [Pseudolysobacter antarcticus]|uniref:STAS domain-containing protein n=1 Tax=Pseudolysobacter antarcticus TaxID=2511995 RepID=A0A411HG28_9GAMM|nr:STAS domain-containing protein [Pseudolysobacter antarcticus]QBB69400.1 STAS domain-containing protein [Pseudolysobacter antarcticus]